MVIHGPNQTAALLPYPALTRSISDVLRAKLAGETQSPDRMHMPLPGGGTLLVMPASDDEIAITKLVSLHPDNPGKNLPLLVGEVVVMDAINGERLGVLDGPMLTGRRTAALSLLAAQLLAPARGPLLMVGAGVQARHHLEAFNEGLGIQEVLIKARSSENAEKLADHAKSLGMMAHAVDDIDRAIDHCPLIITATTSTTPVIPANVRSDAFVCAVGAYTPQMAEIPPDLINKARLFADTLEGACREAGDFLLAGADLDSITPLEQRLDLPAPTSGPVVYKSTGHALFDLAAAKLAFSNQ